MPVPRSLFVSQVTPLQLIVYVMAMSPGDTALLHAPIRWSHNHVLSYFTTSIRSNTEPWAVLWHVFNLFKRKKKRYWTDSSVPSLHVMAASLPQSSLWLDDNVHAYTITATEQYE